MQRPRPLKPEGRSCPACRTPLSEDAPTCPTCFTHVPLPPKVETSGVRRKPRKLPLIKSQTHSHSMLAGGLIFLGCGVLALVVVLAAKKGNEPGHPPSDHAIRDSALANQRAREAQEELDRRRQSIEEEWILRRKQELEARRAAEAEVVPHKTRIEPPPPPPPAPPADSPPPPKEEFDVAVFKKALEALSSEANLTLRADCSSKLAGTLDKPYSKTDLAIITRTLLERAPLDSGLAIDRMRVKSPQIEMVYEGVFENATKDLVPLRLRSGALVSASRSFQERWTVQPPEGAVIADCRIHFEPDSPTREGDLLRAHFRAFPPVQWASFGPADHVRASRSLFEAVAAAGLPNSQATGHLKVLAASHAAAALASDTHSAEAETILKSRGMTLREGMWLGKEDAVVFELVSALRGSHPQAAAGFSESERTFRLRYLDYIRFHIRMPLSKEEFPDLVKALFAARDSASSGTQSRHMSALIDHIGKFKVCNACKGDHRIPCERCGGKGQVRLVCGSCNGRGTVLVAGVGGGERACPNCNGTGDRGTGDCSGCKGDGSRICKSCEAPFKAPGTAELGAWKECSLCSSAALMGNRIGHLCPRCFGLGSVLVPALNKTAELR